MSYSRYDRSTPTSTTAVLKLFLFACSSHSEIDEKLKNIISPKNWQNNKLTLAVKNNWLAELNNPYAQQLVQKALAANHQLAIQAYSLKIAEQQLIISGSKRWPELDFTLNSNRTKDNNTRTYRNANSVELELSYEVDIWGKLSDADRMANYNYLAQKSTFNQYKQQLVTDV